MARERKMRTNFFCTSFLNTPRGPGHPGKIPGTSQIRLFETQGTQTFEGRHELSATTPSGFRKRGLANGVSPFFSENETEKNGKKRNKTEENGKKRKENGKKTGKKRKKTEENGRKRKKSEATPFRRPLLRNPDPFAWRTPTPQGGLRTEKVNLCALFSCLNGIRSSLLSCGIAQLSLRCTSCTVGIAVQVCTLWGRKRCAYCQRRIYYRINSEKGGSSYLKKSTGMPSFQTDSSNLSCKKAKSENGWKR